jgi:trk system potassium uptake protein TrkH
LNILYSFYFNFFLDLNSYVISLIISLSAGLIFCLLGRKYRKNIFLSDQIILIISSFIFLPLLICIPYFLSVYDISFLNSYFESLSGFTTTGFSVIDDIQDLDDPLLMWRSSSQWLGGLFFLIAIIGTLGNKAIKIKPTYLFLTENSGGNFYNSFSYNFFRILLIYFLSTIFIIFLFNLSNIRLLDSFNLAFTTISSGGFLPKKNLSDIITNNTQALALSFSLLFPVFNFYLIYKIVTKQFNFREHQEDLHLGAIVILLTLLFYFFVIPNEGLANVFLAVTSSLSTSGIAMYSSNLDLSLFFILLTVIGGSLISTSSGLKYIRLYILFKISYQEINKVVKPKNIFNRNLFHSEIKIDDQDSKIAFLVFISFIIAMFILSSILTLDNLSFENSFKLSILTLTNTVTSSLYGIENLSFYNLNSFTKIVLMIFMILGKIEIIAVLFLIKKFIFRE